jgi:hypothetical protein
MLKKKNRTRDRNLVITKAKWYEKITMDQETFYCGL